MIATTKQIQIEIQDDDKKSLGFLQVFLNGDKSYIYGLNGKAILRQTLKELDDILRVCKVKSINAIMDEIVLQKIKSLLEDDEQFELEVKKEIEHVGRKMWHIEIKGR